MLILLLLFLPLLLQLIIITQGPIATKLETILKKTLEAVYAKATLLNDKYHVVSKVTEIAKTVDEKYGIVNKATTIYADLDKKYSLKEKASKYTEFSIKFAKDIDAKYSVAAKAESVKNFILAY